MCKTAVQAAARATYDVQRITELLLQMLDIPWDQIRQVTILRLAPDVFHRIEFRSVGREPGWGLERSASIPAWRHALRQWLAAPTVTWRRRATSAGPMPCPKSSAASIRRASICFLVLLVFMPGAYPTIPHEYKCQ